MSVLRSNLDPGLLDQLWRQLPSSCQAAFRTDGYGQETWRKLLAFNPVATFTLDDPQKIDEFRSFIINNRGRLCAGYLAYDLGFYLHDLHSRHACTQPLAVFHTYDNWLEFDKEGTWIKSSDDQYRKFIDQLLRAVSPAIEHKASLSFKPALQQAQYDRNITAIQHYIRAGDFYQMNYTQQLKAKTNKLPRDLYPELIQGHPAAQACYFEAGEQAIHSLSPELFLHYAHGILTTEPIKGTRPRGRDKIEDESLRLELLASEKEQAELFMITDLLRNDLGQVCEVGSIKLETIKALKKLPKVWHTSSRISGKIRSDLHAVDALLSMFPGGSITGCPKHRALEVIDELEVASRGIYTGSLGYFHPDGDFSFNIAIRTLVQNGSELTLGSGGGITIDSVAQAEWDELMVKASTFE